MSVVVILAVALGGAFGALLRHLLIGLAGAAPTGVLVANVLACGGLGAVTGAASVLPEALVLLLGTGMCGALSTWSTLAVQVWRAGERSVVRGFVLLLGTGALAFPAVWAGWWLGGVLAG